MSNPGIITVEQAELTLYGKQLLEEKGKAAPATPIVLKPGETAPPEIILLNRIFDICVEDTYMLQIRRKVYDPQEGKERNLSSKPQTIRVTDWLTEDQYNAWKDLLTDEEKGLLDKIPPPTMMTDLPVEP